MLKIHRVDQTAAALALTAELDGYLVGFAVADSSPRRLHVRSLEGDTHACHHLLEGLVRAAGERDLSGWVPADRPDLRWLFEQRGFIRGVRGQPEGRLAYFYFWDRNKRV
jgi:hypothetical protein